MNFPADLRYTSEHVWVQIDGDDIIVGITDFAQDELGDILFVDVPSVGDTFASGEIFAEIESGKTASELEIPFTGEVTAVNEDLDESPELINEDPYTNWIAKFSVEDLSELEGLLTAAEYEESLVM